MATVLFTFESARQTDCTSVVVFYQTQQPTQPFDVCFALQDVIVCRLLRVHAQHRLGILDINIQVPRGTNTALNTFRGQRNRNGSRQNKTPCVPNQDFLTRCLRQKPECRALHSNNRSTQRGGDRVGVLTEGCPQYHRRNAALI